MPNHGDRQKALSAMNQLMQDILLNYKSNVFLQRTSLFTKLQILADKAGVELLEWMKGYTIENNPETIPINLPPAADSNTIYALDAMTAIMVCYPDDSKKRQDHLKRSGYKSLIRFSFRARVPLIEWIISYYKTNYSLQLLPDTSTSESYKCPACNEAFKSAEALKGHGPNRCRTKYAKLALNAHES